MPGTESPITRASAIYELLFAGPSLGRLVSLILIPLADSAISASSSGAVGLRLLSCLPWTTHHAIDLR